MDDATSHQHGERGGGGAQGAAPADLGAAGTFELAPPAAPSASATPHPATYVGCLPGEILVRNARWFCMLRWIVVGTLATIGLLGLVPGLPQSLGVRPRLAWPFAIAALLALNNAAFLGDAHRLRPSAPTGRALVNLWSQIGTDLLVLTVVVHFIGSLDTYAPFAYLFHIVLACIFISRGQSLVVTLLACALYAACVTLEQSLRVSAGGIFAPGVEHARLAATGPVAILNFLLLLTILLVVWYMASHLASLVRRRDAELVATNRRLVQAQEERARHMLCTTHELKAPFAAIHANAQLLLGGYCGPLPAAATEVVGRIAARCQRLARAIQEMLHLANLQSAQTPRAPATRVDLAQLLRACVAQVQPTAEQRGIRIETELEPAPFEAVEEHMKLLLDNLVTNAVNYSRDGGQVRISARAGDGAGPVVRIADGGIGIAPAKLPRIFDEFYRTEEAVAHDRGGTGLGLAIVRAIAQSNGILVRVSSRPGQGATFTLEFPRPAA